MLNLHLPNRDHRRNGVTTLKFACTHGPRFLTGDCASNKLTAATLRGPRIAWAVSTAHRRAMARDSFLGCRAPP